MANSILVGVEETAHGTLSATMGAVPVAFTPREQQPNRMVEEVRNSQDMHWSVQQGVRWSEWEIAESYVYHDSIGWFLASVLGTPTATVAAGETTVWDYAYALETDPDSLSFQYDDPRRSADPSQMLNAAVDELTVTFSAGSDGQLMFSCNGVAMPPSVIASPTYAFTTSVPFQHWAGAITIDGTGSYAKLISGSVTIRRNRSPFYTIANSQDPQRISIGRREVEFEFVADMDSTDELADWRAALAAGTGSLVASWTDARVAQEMGVASTNPAFALDIGSPAYLDSEKDWEPDEPQINISGSAIYNATDSSKLLATLTSTAVYNP